MFVHLIGQVNRAGAERRPIRARVGGLTSRRHRRTEARRTPTLPVTPCFRGPRQNHEDTKPDGLSLVSCLPVRSTSYSERRGSFGSSTSGTSSRRCSISLAQAFHLSLASSLFCGRIASASA